MTESLHSQQKDNVTNLLCEHLPINKAHHLLALDITSVSRPYAEKLTDRGYVHCNEPVPGKKPITVGHEYSCLAYLPDSADRWALPLRIDRVPTSENGVMFGMSQVRQVEGKLNQDKPGMPCVIVADSAYSSKAALCENHTHNTILIARLRGNRKLLRPAAPGTPHQTRKHWYDQKYPFRLNDSKSWGTPAEQTTVDWLTRGGKLHHVHIERWDDLRIVSDKNHDLHAVALSVVKILVSKQDKSSLYQHPLWLVIEGSWQETLSLENIWDGYRLRFDVEHFFRFAKLNLLLSHYQTPDTMTEENWMKIVMLSYHQIFHARHAAQFCANPWEKSKKCLQKITPRFVQRDMVRLLSMATPTLAVKPRGIGAGRHSGIVMQKRPCAKPVFKSKNGQKANKSTFTDNTSSTKVNLSMAPSDFSPTEAALQPVVKKNSTGPPA